MTQRWIHPEKARYYQVELGQDLLGDWTLILDWGGLGSRRGGRRIHAVASEAAGQAQLEQIAKRRRQHGYVLVRGDAEEAEMRRRARAFSRVLPPSVRSTPSDSPPYPRSLAPDLVLELDGESGER